VKKKGEEPEHLPCGKKGAKRRNRLPPREVYSNFSNGKGKEKEGSVIISLKRGEGEGGTSSYVYQTDEKSQLYMKVEKEERLLMKGNRCL